LSKSTVRALTAARESNAKAALITANSNTPAQDKADVVLTTPLRDKSYCHTVGYTSPILAACYLASVWRREEFPATDLAEYMRMLLTLRPIALKIGGELAKAQRLIAAGSLIDDPTARELALKVAEGAWVPTTMLGVEDTLHGHLVGHDASSAAPGEGEIAAASMAWVGLFDSEITGPGNCSVEGVKIGDNF
jgi:fructoselysine-6-P-deglycase FrlB-like protein